MSADNIHVSPDIYHATSFASDVNAADIFGAGEPLGRTIEAIDAGNVEIVTGKGTTRVIPFTAGQERKVQWKTIVSGANTTISAAVLGL